jgi:hypothetical protein
MMRAFVPPRLARREGGNKDVADMIARYAGASLGLLAFAIVTVAGLFTQNPFTVTLSRGILALFLFCVIGFVLGGAAQLILNEYEKNRIEEIKTRIRGPAGQSGGSDAVGSPVTDGEAAGA